MQRLLERGNRLALLAGFAVMIGAILYFISPGVTPSAGAQPDKTTKSAELPAIPRVVSQGMRVPGPEFIADCSFDFLDWNGDGKLDIYMPSNSMNTAFVYVNEGSKTQPRFNNAIWYAINLTETEPYGMYFVQSQIVCDLNHDGLFDLLVYDGQFRMVYNTGTRMGPNHWNLMRPAPYFPGSPKMIKENSRRTNTPESMYWNQNVFPRQVLTFTVADWDGDGLEDLIVCRFKEEAPAIKTKLAEAPARGVYFYKNVGTKEKPFFDQGVEITTPDGKSIVAPNPIVADIDGDGVLDIVCTETPYVCNSYRVDWPTNSSVQWFRRTNKDDVAKVEPARPVNDSAGKPIPAGVAVRVADFRGVGVKDLFVQDPAKGIRWYHNSANTENEKAVYAPPTVLAAGDFSRYLFWFQPQIVNWFGPNSRDLILHGGIDAHCQWALRRTALYKNVAKRPGELKYEFVGYLNHQGDQSMVPQKRPFEERAADVYGCFVEPMPDAGPGKKRLLMSVSGKLYIFSKLAADGLTFEERTPLELPVVDAKRPVRRTCPRLVDWNQDGKFDLVLGVQIANGAKPLETEYRVYLNKGTNEQPKFDEFMSICDETGKPLVLPGLATNLVGPQCGIAVHDRNRDGKIFDLVMEVPTEGAALRYYQNVSANDKQPRFKFIRKLGDPSPAELHSSHPYFSFYFGDVDGDGLPDIITFYGAPYLYRGIAPAAPPEITNLAVASNGSKGVELRWTRPKGAVKFELRHSDSDFITEHDWSGLPSLRGEYTAAEGSVQTAILPLPGKALTASVAIKSANAKGEMSSHSNVVQAVASPFKQIVLRNGPVGNPETPAYSGTQACNLEGSRLSISMIVGTLSVLACFAVARLAGAGGQPKQDWAGQYASQVKPLLTKYCLDCHSTKAKKGSLDLERFSSAAEVRKDVKRWQQVIEQLEAGEMPPGGKPQPTAAERKQLIAWVTGFLDAEARSRTGDPGHVPLRRLSNAEYDCTIRDLTGADLRPTREFPADGAAGEGFTNAAEALSDITPALFTKYLGAAKQIAEHAVLLPDGFRFSPAKTRRDWTDESLARLRKFYAEYTSDGKLPVQAYLAATIHHRQALIAGKITLEEVAAKEKLNARYLRTLWQTLTDKTPSHPLDIIRARWRKAVGNEAAPLAGEIMSWQKALWKFVPIGSYRYDAVVRQVANDDPKPDPKTKLPKIEPKARDAALLKGYAEFRQCFPFYICFPNVVPTDEVVCLKMFHREDEPLERLFLDETQKRRLDHLWSEHRFISQQPKAENDYLPQFIGFVTQDQPKELLKYFESQRPAFKKRADEFQQDYQAAIPKHLDAIVDFASRAYRRPLQEKEKKELRELYHTLQKKDAAHDEAFRGVLARVLVSPAFLFRIEKAPPGKDAAPVNDWELATRLSYFLWSSTPDDELRQIAAGGKLREPKVLEAQTRRMLKDQRLRSLAIEFGTQWIHVRGFDDLKEKNEKLFPTFNADLRKAIYEESILFFQDLFQADRPVTRVLDANYTFLNEALAKHYAIPGVTGPQWRRVDGVQKFGRGGILGLASVQARQSGASRTSPVLRGNWVVETLLGEKLPRPPADVPILPDVEANDKLTTRQMVEKHVSVASCANCHVRIDPFGFAFEMYDAIGRFRQKDTGGLPIDARAKLKDGTEFEGIDGLRNYLLKNKKEVVVRLFCRKLLGYALGRSTTLSDTVLIDEMVSELDKSDGRISVAVMVIVRSPQFRMIRGSEYEE